MKACEIHMQECSQKEERRVFFEANATDHCMPLRRVQWLLLYFSSFGVCHFGGPFACLLRLSSLFRQF